MRSGCQKRWQGWISSALLMLATAGLATAEVIELPVPAGVLPPEIPADNPPTAAKVELGQTLYFDTHWCILNPLEGQELAHDDDRMRALEAYILVQRAGVPLAAGKH